MQRSYPQLVRNVSHLSQEQRDIIANGPGLEEFVTGNAPPTPDYLKRKKGHRLRLPEWLKTDIPLGKNYHRLKKDLRRLNLSTVSLPIYLSIYLSIYMFIIMSVTCIF